MTNEPKVMQELYKIRERIYEDTKHMSPKERAALARKEAQEMIEIYGLKVKRLERSPDRSVD